MKKSKILLLTLLLSVGFGFSECNWCSCPDVDGSYYNLLGVDSFKHLSSNDVISSGMTVDFEDYCGLNLLFLHEFTFGQSDNMFSPFSNFSLINTAYGCSCNYNGYDGSLQSIDAIHIITLNDFDSLHLANDTINEYFTTDYDMPLDSFIVNVGKPETYRLPLFLTEQPALDSTFQVKMTVELDDGAVYSMESDAIIIR
ncbi:MAG: hypothetical protein ACPG19_03105 [Saprospiraceae bacterium]